MKMLDTPGVGLAFIDGGKIVWAGGLGVKELGKPDPVDARHALHRGVEHQGADDAAARRAGGRGEDALGPAGDRAVPAFKLGDEATTKQVQVRAPHLRLHRHAAAGPGVAVRVPQRDADVGAEAPRHDAADEPLRRGLPVQQPDGGGGRLHRRLARRCRGKEWGAAYDEAMRTKVFEPLGMKTTTFDFAKALKGDVAQPHGDDVDGKVVRRAHGPELLRSCRCGRRAASGRARASWRSTSRWSSPRACSRTASGSSRQENLLARYEPNVHRRRGRHLRHGAHGGQALRRPGRAPRRRPRRLPQRHDLAARVRRRRGDPHQRRLRASSSAGRCCGGCSRCCSTASPRPSETLEGRRGAAQGGDRQGARAAGGPGRSGARSRSWRRATRAPRSARSRS